MKVYGVRHATLEGIARDMGITLYEVGNIPATQRSPSGISFMLRPGNNEEFRKISMSGRRVFAVTWVAHYVFMQRMFNENPEAKLTSTLATYNGQDEFFAKAGGTRTSWVM